jgi:type II secretory pathway pseudopilin PulG
MLAVLSILATSLVAQSLEYRRAGANELAEAQRRWQLDGAIRAVLLDLAFPNNAQTTISLAERSLPIGDAVARVTISLETERTDLNTATANALQKALQIANVDVSTSATKVANLLQYRATGTAGLQPSSNRPSILRSISDVRQVPTWEIMPESTLRNFTVYGYQESPAPRVVSIDAGQMHGQVIRVTACSTESVRTRCRHLIGRLTGNARNPLMVYEWH